MKVFRRVLSGLLSVALLMSTGFVVFRAQDVRDWWALRGYTPSAEVAGIASSTTMTPYAKHVFYVYDPQIEEGDEFNRHCSQAEVSIVLGCYNGNGIYVYNVSDPRLKGEHDVTAAHEMLHAAYDRLSGAERSKVDAMTASAFAGLGDERIKTVIASYRSRDPHVVPNELHSILGTEVRTLPSDLEEYYRKYFTNRLAVVSFSEGYEQVFTDNKNKVDAYDVQLTQLKTKIETDEKDLQSRSAFLSAEKSRLDALYKNRSSDYPSRAATYNGAVQSYNDDLAAYKALIVEYNQIVAARNALTIVQNSLVQALDSHATSL